MNCLICKNYLYGSRNWATKIVAVWVAISMYFAGAGQECPTFFGGTIKVKADYEKICAGTGLQVELGDDVCGGSGEYEWEWEWRTNGDNGIWLDENWKPILNYTAKSAPSASKLIAYDTTQIRRKVQDNDDGGTAYSNTVTVIILDPKMDDIPTSATQIICSGGAVEGVIFTPVSEVIEYKWEATGDWSKISTELSSGVGNFGSFTAKENKSGEPYIATISVRPKIGNCLASEENKKTFTITLNSEPAINIDNIKVYNGDEASAVTFDTPVSRATVDYEWSTTGDWTDISMDASSGLGYFGGFTANENSSGKTYLATITVKSKIGNGLASDENQKTFTITNITNY